MDDAGIELLIVEQSAGCDPNSAAVLRRIAEYGEHDLLVATIDAHATWSKARQHAQNCVEVDRRSAKMFYALVGVARDFGVEAEARDAGVAEVVGERHVDFANDAVDCDPARFTDRARNSVDARKVVARSATGLHDLLEEVAHAVASADDDPIVAAAGTLRGRPRQIRRTRAGIGVDFGAEVAEVLLDFASVMLRAAPTGSRVVN